MIGVAVLLKWYGLGFIMLVLHAPPCHAFVTLKKLGAISISILEPVGVLTERGYLLLFISIEINWNCN